MCGYLIDESKLDKLSRMSVKDSKLLTPQKREKLVPKLKKLSDDFILVKITAGEIDRLRSVSNLNKIEIARMRLMIDLLKPEKVVVDSPERNTNRFRAKILENLRHNGFYLVAENFADRNHVEVGAASIIAKVHRDAEIEKLHRKHGFFGSGYTSDWRTIAFLKDWMKRNKEFPDFVRKSWITAMLIKEERQQRQMAEFLKGDN
jgi:ribonuclease HII